MINRASEKQGGDPLQMKEADFAPNAEELLPFRQLEHIPQRDLQIRFCLLKQFNREVASVLPFVDFRYVVLPETGRSCI